jgi:fructosamine-3-kinase
VNLQSEIEAAIGSKTVEIARLGGGCVGQVFKVRLEDGTQLVAKVDLRSKPLLNIEAAMLRYLSSHSPLPVPEVIFGSETLLLMELLPGRSEFDNQAQEHAAELLAATHAIRAHAFGFKEDTLIGGLLQPNAWLVSWLNFFGERRLMYMAGEARKIGRLSSLTFARLDKLSLQLDRWLDEPEFPSLIHGDVWTTNVLASGGHIVGFLDPAVYFAHAEIELAFITLFGTFGKVFFDRYQELRPIPVGFFEERRDIYNLYPLLVHVYLFGGSYENAIDRTLRSNGF